MKVCERTVALENAESLNYVGNGRSQDHSWLTMLWQTNLKMTNQSIFLQSLAPTHLPVEVSNDHEDLQVCLIRAGSGPLGARLVIPVDSDICLCTHN